jgi:hypothetical protein
VAPLAHNVLRRLVADGRFDARGMPASSAVLVALRAMLAAGTLRATPGRPRFFALAPEHEIARRALAGAR